MRTILVIAMLAACAGDDGPDPHESIACEPGKWGTATTCERGCATGATGGVDANMDGNDDTCRVSTGLGMLQCPVAATTAFEGERGCCVNEGPIRFYACEAQ